MENGKRVRGRPNTEYEGKEGWAVDISWVENIPKDTPIKVEWDNET